MERTAVFDVVRAKAVELLDLEPGQLAEDVTFREDLSVDSLALVEYCMALEDELGVVLPEDEVAGAATVGAFVDLVTAKTAGAARTGSP